MSPNWGRLGVNSQKPEACRNEYVVVVGQLRHVAKRPQEAKGSFVVYLVFRSTVAKIALSLCSEG